MDVQEILSLVRPGRKAALRLDQAVHAFHAFGPRCRFVKTMRLGASILDAGAGQGTLQVYRHWPPPDRTDLKMFAWAGQKGSNFDLYDGHEVSLWPDNKPHFNGQKFDAVLAANFIEHIDDPIDFVAWAISLLTPTGRLYLEWPRPESAALPTTGELAAVGLGVMTGNYFDDATHRRAIPDFGSVCRAITERGLAVRESGTVSVPFFDQELAIIAAATGDIVHLTLSYWSLTGWCQYLVAGR